MGRSERFASLGNPDATGYIIYEYAHDGPSSRHGDRIVAHWLAKYDTYGDGLTQHGPEYPVAMKDMGDVLASLAAAARDGGPAMEFLAHNWPRDRYDRDTVRAAVKVLYREGKQRWYNIHSLAVSPAQRWRNDRRWEEVVPWMDGGVCSVIGLLNPYKVTLTGVELYTLAQFVQKTMRELGCDQAQGWRMGDHYPELRDPGHLLEFAVKAVDSLVAAREEREWAEAALDSYKGAVASIKERQERQAASS